MITLKELCKKVGVSRRSIQCYENAGLMKSQDKNKYGYLLYSNETVELAKRIRFMQELGFKLKEIDYLFNLSIEEQRLELEKKIEMLEEEEKRRVELIKIAKEYLKSI